MQRNFLAKIDHQVSSRDQFSVRYSLYTSRRDNSRGAGALNAPSASAGLDNIDQSLAFSNTLTLSSATVNETRARSLRRSEGTADRSRSGPPSASPASRRSARSSGSPQGRVNTMYQVVNNLSHQAGAHALRAGVDFIYNDDTHHVSAVGPRRLHVLVAGELPRRARTTPPASRRRSATRSSRRPIPMSGIYVQDEWKVRSALTLNAGLRYDLQFLETIDTDTNNVSPRLGFAWSPFEPGRTIVRGSAGLFFDRVPLRALANALLSAGNTTDLTSCARSSVSLSPDAGRGAGVSRHPAGGRPVGDAGRI